MDASVFLTLLTGALGLGAIYFLVAAGLALIFGLQDVLNMAHALFITLGAYLTWYCMAQATWIPDPGIRFLASVGFGVGVGFVVAVGVERLFVRPVYGNHLTQILITIGVALCGNALVGAVFSYEPKLLELPPMLQGTVPIGGALLPAMDLLAAACGAVMWVAITCFLKLTRYGIIIRAGSFNRNMVTALGINVQRSFAIVFGLGGACAALGGIFAAAHFPGFTPPLGMSLLTICFVVVILGGVRSVTGCGIAAVVIGIIEEFGTFLGPAGTGELAIFLVLALILLMPIGRIGKLD